MPSSTGTMLHSSVEKLASPSDQSKEVHPEIALMNARETRSLHERLEERREEKQSQIDAHKKLLRSQPPPTLDDEDVQFMDELRAETERQAAEKRRESDEAAISWRVAMASRTHKVDDTGPRFAGAFGGVHSGGRGPNPGEAATDPAAPRPQKHGSSADRRSGRTLIRKRKVSGGGRGPTDAGSAEVVHRAGKRSKEADPPADSGNATAASLLGIANYSSDSDSD